MAQFRTPVSRVVWQHMADYHDAKVASGIKLEAAQAAVVAQLQHDGHLNPTTRKPYTIAALKHWYYDQHATRDNPRLAT